MNCGSMFLMVSGSDVCFSMEGGGFSRWGGFEGPFMLRMR